MQREVRCKACQATLKVDERHFGKRLKCPHCTASILVPAPKVKTSQARRKVSPKPRSVDAAEFDGELDFDALQKLEKRGQSLGQGRLIKCRDCGDSYGRKEAACVHCGTPNNFKGPATGRRDRRRGRKKTTPFDAWREFFHEYEGLLRPLGFVCLFLTLCGVAVYFIDWGSKPNVPGRPQKEFGNRTTTKWIELEREGKARKVEVLWQDQRWIPLDQYLGLDWAAVPEWFKALTEDRTKGLAETILGKYNQTTGTPYLDDLQAGLKHQDPLVRTWAARLASKLENDASAVVPLLEKAAKDKDPALSKAAAETLEKLGMSDAG